MKLKLLSTFAASITALSVVFTASCSGSKKVEIGATVYSGADPFITLVKNAMQGKSKDLGDSMNVIDSQNNQTKQNDQVDALIRKGVKVLVINLVDPTAGKTIINKAKAKNLPIVLWNKETSKADINSYKKAWYVGAEAKQSGIMQAQDIYADMNLGAIKDRDGNGKLGYFVIGGETGHPDAIARTIWVRKGLYDLISKNGVNADKFTTSDFKAIGGSTNIKENANHVIAIKKGLSISDVKALFSDFTTGSGDKASLAEWTDWTEAQGKAKAAPHLTNQATRLDFISANNDGTALGAVAAIKAKSNIYKPYTAAYPASSDTNYLPVYGVDATSAGIASIKAGYMGGTVLNDAQNQGKLIVIVAHNAMKGKTGIELATGMPKGSYTWEADKKAFRVPYVAVGRTSDRVTK